MQGPELGGIVNLPAIAIIAVVAGLLLVGTRESATLNAILVLVKVDRAGDLCRGRAPRVQRRQSRTLQPLWLCQAYGAGRRRARRHGRRGDHLFRLLRLRRDRHRGGGNASNPDRDLKIGIVGSMFVCVVIYIAVAVAAVGAIAYTRFANSPEPLALILRELGSPLAAQYLAVSAIIALPTVILAFFYGQSRIFFTMARDGLLPASLATLSSRGTPVRITIFTALVVAVLAGFIPLGELAALANAGTLAAFTAVSICMLIMRVRAPDAPRTFRAPMPWVIGGIAVLRLYLSVLQPAGADAAVVPGVERRRAGGLFPLRPAECGGWLIEFLPVAQRWGGGPSP